MSIVFNFNYKMKLSIVENVESNKLKINKKGPIIIYLKGKK
jgi:hypothetical protein